jgi:hypothetical protein
MPVISKIRGTAAPETASSTSPPLARARLCASTSAWIAAESQNRVRVRSTTSVRCPVPAAWPSAARSPSALVMSISSGAATTGVPRTISTGKLASRILHHLPWPRPDRGTIRIRYEIDTCQEIREKYFAYFFSR